MAYLNVMTHKPAQRSARYPMKRHPLKNRLIHAARRPAPWTSYKGYEDDFEGMGRFKIGKALKKITKAVTAPLKPIINIATAPLKLTTQVLSKVAKVVTAPAAKMAAAQKKSAQKTQQKITLKAIATRAQMLAQGTTAESQAAITQQAAQAAADRAAAAQTAADQLQAQVEQGQATQAQANQAAQAAADAAAAAAAYPPPPATGYAPPPSAMIPTGSTPSAQAQPYYDTGGGYDTGADIEASSYDTGEDVEAMAPEEGGEEPLDYTAEEPGGAGAVQVMDEWGEGGDETMQGLGVLRRPVFRHKPGGRSAGWQAPRAGHGAYKRLTPAQQTSVDTLKHPGESHFEFGKRMKAEGKNIQTIIRSMPLLPPPPPPSVGEDEFEGMGLSKKGRMYLKYAAIGGAVIGGGLLLGPPLLAYLNKGGSAKVPVTTPDGTKVGDASVANGVLQAAPAVVQSVLAAQGINPAQASPTDVLNAVGDIKSGRHPGGSALAGMFGGDIMTYMLWGTAAVAVYYFLFAKKRRA
jgi:hypothetical protein